jgi:hypothetical protein
MIVEQLAVPSALEKHFQIHGARPEKKVTYKGHDIFLAQGGPHYDAKNHKIVDSDPGPGELLKEDEWMKDGYYLSAWGVMRGKAVIGFPLYFKINHDQNRTTHDRAEARMNSALYAAEDAIDSMIAVGLLDHYEGKILIA